MTRHRWIALIFLALCMCGGPQSPEGLGLGSGPDSTSELVFYSRSTGSGHIMDADGAGGLVPIYQHEGWLPGWDGYVMGEFGGDGHTDMLFFDLANGVGAFHTSDGAGGMPLLRLHANWLKTWDQIIPGNFNGDAFTDLLFVDFSSGNASVIVTDGAGGMTQIAYYSNWNPAWDLIVPGQFNHDKITDLLFVDLDGGQAAFTTTDGAGGYTQISYYDNLATSWDAVVPGNFNGDRLTDLLFVDFSAGVGSLQTTNGSGAMTELRTHTNLNTGWDQVVVGDFSGIGADIDDLLFYDRDRGWAAFVRVDALGGMDQFRFANDWRTDWDVIVASPERNWTPPISYPESRSFAQAMGYEADKLKNDHIPNLVVLLFETEGRAFQPVHDGSWYSSLLTGGNYPNVVDYFSEVSGGMLSIGSIQIVGPMNLPASANTGTGEQIRTNMLDIAYRAGVDWSKYDRPEHGGNDDRLVNNEDVVVVAISSASRVPVLNDPNDPSQGSSIPDVQAIVRGTSPEWLVFGESDRRFVDLDVVTGGESLSFATLVHEIVHVIGPQAVDLYAQSGCTICNGGTTLMGTTISNQQDVLQTATHLDPWNRMRFGWTEPRIFRLGEPGMCATIANWADPTTLGSEDRRPVILYDPARGWNEYFILEYRNPTTSVANHYDNITSGGTWSSGGLGVWHVATSIPGGLLSTQTIMTAGGATDTLAINQLENPTGGIGASGFWGGSQPSDFQLQWLDGTDLGIVMRVGTVNGPTIDVMWEPVSFGDSWKRLPIGSAERSCFSRMQTTR